MCTKVPDDGALGRDRGSQLDHDTDSELTRILVDTELTLDGCAQKVVGAGLGTETLCIIVIIIRGNHHLTVTS